MRHPVLDEFLFTGSFSIMENKIYHYAISYFICMIVHCILLHAFHVFQDPDSDEFEPQPALSLRERNQQLIEALEQKRQVRDLCVFCFVGGICVVRGPQEGRGHSSLSAGTYCCVHPQNP